MTFPRQPPASVIAPSNQSPWVGRVERADDRFTTTQLYYMARLGRTADEPGECITVFREATQREMYWARGEAPPVYQFDCPVIGRRRDGKVHVIAPGGDKKWVFRNGWVDQPHHLNRHLLNKGEAQ